jgi:hypothetical protein
VEQVDHRQARLIARVAGRQIYSHGHILSQGPAGHPHLQPVAGALAPCFLIRPR